MNERTRFIYFLVKKYMQRLGTKSTHFRPLGGKLMNQGLKFGSKALGWLGDLTPAAAMLAPELAPVLETAKLTSIGLSALQKAKQLAK